MATGFQRLQAALAQLENVPEAEIPELPPLAREFDPETAEGSELVRYIPERGAPIKNLLNRFAAELGIATPRMWRERERDLVVGEEAWQKSVAATERLFNDGVQGAMQYAATDIDNEQLRGIAAKFQEGITAARSENPAYREFGARLMAEAQAQLAPWLEDIETRREALIDGELRHLEVLYRDGEKDLGVAESVRDAAVLRLGQFNAKWNTVDFEDASLTERQRKALALDEIGYMAQAPDMLDGLLRGAQSLSGAGIGAAVMASNPYVRFGLLAASALAAGATNLRGLADDFTAAELRDIIQAGYHETQAQTEYRIDAQVLRLNDLERRRAQLSQLPMMRREHPQSAPSTRGAFHPNMRSRGDDEGDESADATPVVLPPPQEVIGGFVEDVGARAGQSRPMTRGQDTLRGSR